MVSLNRMVEILQEEREGGIKRVREWEEKSEGGAERGRERGREKWMGEHNREGRERREGRRGGREGREQG